MPYIMLCLISLFLQELLRSWIEQREQFLAWHSFLVLPLSAVAILCFSFEPQHARATCVDMGCSTVVLCSVSLCTFIQLSEVLKVL